MCFNIDCLTKKLHDVSTCLGRIREQEYLEIKLTVECNACFYGKEEEEEEEEEDWFISRNITSDAATASLRLRSFLV